MQSDRADAPRGAFAEINVTPMADIMIVLLIIFMVVTPMLGETPGLAPPDSRTADETPRDPIVRILASGAIEMGGESFASPGELTLRLYDRLAGEPEGAKVVQVIAHRDLPYGRVLAVLQACRAAGSPRIALLTRRLP
jgi:biopolymer transport protein ExbD